MHEIHFDRLRSQNLVRLLSSVRKMTHFASTDLPSSQPQVLLPQPVLVLGRAQLGSQASGSSSAMLIQDDSILEISPRTINGLSSYLPLHCLLGSWQGAVTCHANIGGTLPSPFALHLDALLAVHHVVVDDPGHLNSIALGSIGV